MMRPRAGGAKNKSPCLTSAATADYLKPRPIYFARPGGAVMARSRCFIVGLAAALWLGAAAPARAGLFYFVQKTDDSFSLKVKKKTQLPQGTGYNLQLVSQTWQSIRWEHDLQVFLPKGVKPGGKMLLWNQGGKASVGSTAFGMQLAKKAQTPVALLFGIPNQPLLENDKKKGLTEDA